MIIYCIVGHFCFCLQTAKSGPGANIQQVIAATLNITFPPHVL